MRFFPAVVLAVVGASAGAVWAAAYAPLPTVERVDLARYSGRWYEIARLPNRFQRQCAGDVTATYAPRDDGTIAVDNACRRDDGAVEHAQGVARVADPVSNAKLEVRFAPAFLGWLPFVWGDYWVLDLDAGYRHALVGEPSREYLWVLARTPAIDDASYARLVARARELGFDASRLARTPQTAGPRG